MAFELSLQDFSKSSDYKAIDDLSCLFSPSGSVLICLFHKFQIFSRLAVSCIVICSAFACRVGARSLETLPPAEFCPVITKIIDPNYNPIIGNVSISISQAPPFDIVI